MSSNEWVKSEFKGINLGDKRLNDRLVTIVNQFMSTPESPINKVCKNWHATKAAYRFFDHDNIDYNHIIDHHAKNTRRRSENEEIVLAIQDTTYFNYSSHPKTTGLGLLSRFTGKYKKDILTKGLCMHTTLAINTSGLPIGLLNQNIVARPILSDEEREMKKKSHGNHLPIEEKESIRWLNALEATEAIFQYQNKKVVTIADREADIYDLFLLAEELNTHYLVRASHNRKVNKTAIHSEKSGEFLWDVMDKKKSIGELQVCVPAKKDQPKRVAQCCIKVAQVKVLPSRHYKGDKSRIKKLSISVVQVVEKNPPKGCEKIDWVLHTNIPVTNYDDAIEKVKWYCLRWRIEVYFKVIKSGFNVEDCRLKTADRLIRYLAVVSIVAWRVFWLTMVSRTSPDTPIADLLTEEEWKVLFVTFNAKKQMPVHAPPLKEVTAWIAQLGGFLARENDGDPDITHIWRGLQKLYDMVAGLQLYQKIYG